MPTAFCFQVVNSELVSELAQLFLCCYELGKIGSQAVRKKWFQLQIPITRKAVTPGDKGLVAAAGLLSTVRAFWHREHTWQGASGELGQLNLFLTTSGSRALCLVNIVGLYSLLDMCNQCALL